MLQESEKTGDLQDIIFFPVVHAIEGQEISLPPTFFFFWISISLRAASGTGLGLACRHN